MTISASEREDIIARNLAAVDVHFHNENADSIDLAVSVYTDDIQCRDGKICRENGYEIWRRADDTTRVQDDIPEGAPSEIFEPS